MSALVFYTLVEMRCILYNEIYIYVLIKNCQFLALPSGEGSDMPLACHSAGGG